MKRIELRDFLNFSFLENLQVSHDGAYAAFVKRDCDEEHDIYPASLWVAATEGGEPKQLIAAQESNILYTWDGGEILWAKPDRYLGEETTACVRINPVTGEQQPAFEIPVCIKRIEAVDDEKYLVSAQTDLRADEDREENGADWYVFDELPFSANGPGYTTSRRRNSLYLFTPGGELQPLTDPWYHVEGYTLSEDRRRAVCWGQEYHDVRMIMPGLSVIDLSTGENKELIPPGVWRVEYADFLGDKVLMCATQGKKYKLSENPNFYLVDCKTGEITTYCEVDVMAKGLGAASDCRYGGGYDIMVRGGRIFFTASKNENGELWEIPEKDHLRQVTHGNGSVDCFDYRRGKLWFVGMRAQRLQEVYQLDPDTGREQCRTSFNTAYSVDHTVVVPEECSFINANGDWVQGWVLPPVDYVKGKKYPAILDIHGGPKTAYGCVYYHEMQLWANHGYFVFFCNPRGSDGRGNDYGLLIGSYGTYDFDDIMEFTDTVLDRYPDIDRDRVGVTGGSYGGFMTNWIVTHTDRFAAAATQRSISNWILHEGACDSGYWFISHMYPPTSRVNHVGWEQSPLRYAENIKTPLLIIQSDHDMRCHTGEGLSLYTQAIHTGVPVRMCLFKDETHELSRSGRPQSRVKRLQEITDWMDKYLKKEGAET